MVRSDNGTEFMVMSSLFKDQDIVHQTSCVNTPQQNCRFERKHKHILNVSRALLFQANLPIKFWGKAVLTAAYLINRNPSSVLNGRSSYEVIHGVAPDYKALRVFGSVCYVHRTSRDKDKFGPRSRLCVFVGYPIGKKCWKVYDIDRNVFLVSRDVVFREDLFPYADQKTEPADGSRIDTVSDEDWNLPPLGVRGSVVDQSDISGSEKRSRFLLFRLLSLSQRHLLLPIQNHLFLSQKHFMLLYKKSRRQLLSKHLLRRMLLTTQRQLCLKHLVEVNRRKQHQ